MTVLTTAETVLSVSAFARHFDDYYKIEERLHSGAYGIVYRVSAKLQPAKQFAAKFIPRRKLNEREVQDMLSEADILRDIRGMEHVVEFVDFFAEKDYFTIVQGLARGGDVFDRVATKHQLYNEQEARSVAIKILTTIQKLHDRDIIHRDIKLENLLLGNRDDPTSVLLADFGFATYLPEGGHVTRRCGTAAYCAPEVWTKQPYGKSADIWSIGVALYILFTGQAPFKGRNHKETLHKACKGELCFEGRHWIGVSEEAKDCIRGLLTVDPSQRWTAKEALNSTWIQSGLTDALFQNLDWDWMPSCCETRHHESGRSNVFSVVPLNGG